MSRKYVHFDASQYFPEPRMVEIFEEQERLADARFARAYARFGVQDISRKPVTSQGAAVRERQGIK